MRNAVKLAADFAGSQAALARVLGVQRSTVNSWIQGRNKIPPETAIKIEHLTHSQITRKNLRPDLFD
ncbi:Cro/CI family transcriptional regulator [Kingella kingae]|uniref:transcriptional regulator n=1 Tax=Kingella kingae TaxID=504 RepID=UPI00254E4FDD|nr:Cro/CI family transcriptional regulator [Kingella kingae]MDK4528027.1 Cro/CI family transcriptional regulator [Kingella kingae]MDK4542387.1 Cro/CI family transcriptional regulator [Kingella kingae]MDK4561794.1 Cro/CI family transcriptional regulator [Kingella kingae]MDK4563725.1 Cro/CI family transcriptional regulator [Kingella kingae]MDK4573807.1 Cro/CI family transcriptional regulator [Kingella kingae]